MAKVKQESTQLGNQLRLGEGRAVFVHKFRANYNLFWNIGFSETFNEKLGIAQIQWKLLVQLFDLNYFQKVPTYPPVSF